MDIISASKMCPKFIVSAIGGFFAMLNIATAETSIYQVGANRTLRITLKVNQEKPLSIEISGNGNSDLDFRVIDYNGKTIYEDLDNTDYTWFKLEDPGVYNLYIINNNEVVNECEIDIEEPND